LYFFIQKLDKQEVQNSLRLLGRGAPKRCYRDLPAGSTARPACAGIVRDKSACMDEPVTGLDPRRP
jgi:ABC-type multidrug transport system ATPase subunit